MPTIRIHCTDHPDQDPAAAPVAADCASCIWLYAYRYAVLVPDADPGF
jgi:hypothetical protein